MTTSFFLPSTGPQTMAQMVASYWNPFFALLFAPPTDISGSSYALTTADAALVNKSTVAMSLTLPPSSLNSGRPLEIMNVSGQAINSTAANVYPAGSTVPGTVIQSSGVGKWSRLRADGANWRIMAQGS